MQSLRSRQVVRACAPVVQHHVRRLHAPQGVQREQSRVPRAGAHQVHLARAAALLVCSNDHILCSLMSRRFPVNRKRCTASDGGLSV